MATGTEFSRIVGLEEAREEASTRRIEADAGERAALARRFGLQALDRLEAQVTVAPSRHDPTIRVEGRLSAEVVQTCVVTLAPVPARIEEAFSLRLLPAGAEAGEVEIDPEAEQPEPLEGEAIDIGEIVAQHLSLALDPYPRAAGAHFEGAAAGPEEAPAAGPFAALERLKRH